jgi:hypothetical protein
LRRSVRENAITRARRRAVIRSAMVFRRPKGAPPDRLLEAEEWKRHVQLIRR